MNSTICIALCSYNGEAFLTEQIESILTQSIDAWALLVRDDASSDTSTDVLKSFKVRDSRVVIIDGEPKNLGAKGNFSVVLKKAATLSPDYLALSDQDDVWMLDKLSSQLQTMRAMENKNPNMPILVHSDMQVVDHQLHEIAPSFMKYQSIKNEDKSPLKVLLAQNFVTGCTVMVNKRLLDIALPIPSEVLMHDWWLALCAAVFGHIGFIDKPLVKYRQHDSNEVGAKHLNDYLNPSTGEWKKRWLEGRDNLFQSMKQAEALAERIQAYDPQNPHLALVEDYAALQNVSGFQRMKKIQQLGIHAQSNSRQALLLSRLWLAPKTTDG